jgi:hypothetical protein
MHLDYAIEISNRKTYCVTHQTTFSNYATLEVPSNLLQVNQTSPIFAQDITEHLSSSLEIPNTPVELTPGQLDVLLLN